MQTRDTMALTELVVHGYRGFAEPQTLSFAIPTLNPGSGLTILVGANNSGKSTIVEALRDCAGGSTPSFTEGKRNEAADKRVRMLTRRAQPR